MFERFTEAGIKSIMLAQAEARRLGHNFVGTEQILLGLIAEAKGIASRSLHAAGVTLPAARIEVEKIIGRGSGFVAVEIPFTPRAKRVLQLSWREAQRLGHDYVGTEHLILGLLREPEGVATVVLEKLGVDRAKLAEQVVLSLGKPAGGTIMPPDPLVPNDTADMMISAVFVWYDADATLCIQRAWGIAETAGAKAIEPEHLLLAALRDDGTIFGALEAAKIKVAELRRQICGKLIFDDARPAQSLPFSEQSKEVLTDTWRLAASLKQMWITKESIFLALLAQEDGVLPRALKELGPDAREREDENPAACVDGGASMIRAFVKDAMCAKPPQDIQRPTEDSTPVGKVPLRIPPFGSAKFFAGFGIYAVVCMIMVLVGVHSIDLALFNALSVSMLFLVTIALCICLTYILRN